MLLRLAKQKLKAGILAPVLASLSIMLLQSCAANAPMEGARPALQSAKHAGGLVGEWTRFDGPSRSCAQQGDVMEEFTIWLQSDGKVTYQRVTCSDRAAGAYEEVEGDGLYRLSGDRITFLSDNPGYFSAFNKSPTACRYKITADDRLILSGCDEVPEDWTFERFDTAHQVTTPAPQRRG